MVKKIFEIEVWIKFNLMKPKTGSIATISGWRAIE
jgi:hypothetical protein